ncbi:hypothetical protein FYK55_12350 [Roseiconus nitratireducens]|uniref:ParB/Sulfiredoxin domain-containing protein n=1 Tax=Roseiconus nitratireducens TaxID=2605748 RepID=A0A5M6DD25_9BACT|nr:hypothetical protein [Roseiconus nitratireducens]KAA5543075.1 hypothetical protein FYK55_12350 [Roseiconus nitratireducens]
MTKPIKKRLPKRKKPRKKKAAKNAGTRKISDADSPNESAQSAAIPSIQEAIAKFPEVKGVSPACALLPEVTDAALRRLRRSIELAGQVRPIELTPDGMLLNGRHRLQVCLVADITPKFTTVESTNLLAHVLADVQQRECNVATRAFLALKIEEIAKLSVQTHREAGDKVATLLKRAKEPTAIKLGDGMRLDVRKGQTIRDASAAFVGATKSAIRRFVTIRNENEAAAMRAVRNEVKMADVERELGIKNGDAIIHIPGNEDLPSDQPSVDEEASSSSDVLAGENDAVVNSSPEPDAHSQPVTNPPKKQKSSAIKAGKPEQPQPGASSELPDAAKSTLSNGVTEYVDGDQSAFFVEPRQNGVPEYGLLLVNQSSYSWKTFETSNDAHNALQEFFS